MRGNEAPPNRDDAEELLSGRVKPDDAPAGYAGVANLLDAMRAGATPPELARETETVTAMVAAVSSSPEPIATGRKPMRPLTRLKVAASVLAGTLALGTGLAAAGALPDSIQRVAATVLGSVGVHVPDPDEDRASVTPQPSPTPTNHGFDVRDVARDDSTSGRDHGEAVCTVASEGRCKNDDGDDRGRSADHREDGEHRGDGAESENEGDDDPADHPGANDEDHGDAGHRGGGEEGNSDHADRD